MEHPVRHTLVSRHVSNKDRLKRSRGTFQISPLGAVGAITLPEVRMPSAIPCKRGQLLTVCGEGVQNRSLTASPPLSPHRVLELDEL